MTPKITFLFGTDVDLLYIGVEEHYKMLFLKTV